MRTAHPEMRWAEGLNAIWGVGGSIFAGEQNGRHYFFVRVRFPRESKWWDRTTETSSMREAMRWIETQENDYRAHALQERRPNKIYRGNESVGYSTDYAYIERAYGLHFESGQRVWHEETRCFGTVKRCNRSSAHYVNVLFDGAKRNGLCHPGSLEVTAASQPNRSATADEALDRG